MAESPTTAGFTLEVLADEIAALREETILLRAESAELKARTAAQQEEITQLRGVAPASSAPRVPQNSDADAIGVAEATSGQRTSEAGGAVSRRGALRALGAAAAGGAGLAIGSAFLSADPAAAVGGDFLLDSNNTVTTASTALSGSIMSNAMLTIANAEATNAGAALYAHNLISGIQQDGTIVGDTNGSPGPAIVGLNSTGNGVYGVSKGASGISVAGLDTDLCGVIGDTNAEFGFGAAGLSSHGTGVYGLGFFDGVIGVSIGDEGTGVQGHDTATGQLGTGVVGESDNGIGVLASGGLAPLFLQPPISSGAVGPPTTGTHQAGELYVDFNGALFYCFAANEWIQINKGFTHLLPNPIRVFDSRITGSKNPALPGRAAGPLALGSPVTLTIAGATVGGVSVPAGAAAVIGNVTVTNVVNSGWLTLYPAGSPTPTTATPSTINYQTSDAALANACTVGLNSSGQMDILAFQGSTQVIFDVTGYIL
jgi:hypothetical protein